MKLEECPICYVPYSLTSVKKIEKEDLLDGKLLSLPKEATKVDENALSSDLKPSIVFIPNTNYYIDSIRLMKKVKANFILNAGTELGSLFKGVVSPKVILPNTLRVIRTSGFQNSKIDELEIPDSVIECDSQIFEHSKIKHLIIHEKLLDMISAKFLLTINDKITITLKHDDEENSEHIVSQINNKELLHFNYIDESIDMFIQNIIKYKNIDNKTIDKFKQKIKKRILVLIKIKLLLKKDTYISLNELIKKDRYFNQIFKVIQNIPNISTDGLSIRVDGKRVKMLSLKEVIN